jgi:hypothetical protein
MELSGQHRAVAALPPGNNTRTHLNWSLWGPMRSGRAGEDKNILILPGFETRTIQLVA